jgi:hypothetical protein
MFALNPDRRLVSLPKPPVAGRGSRVVLDEPPPPVLPPGLCRVLRRGHRDEVEVTAQCGLSHDLDRDPVAAGLQVVEGGRDRVVRHEAELDGPVGGILRVHPEAGLAGVAGRPGGLVVALGAGEAARGREDVGGGGFVALRPVARLAGGPVARRRRVRRRGGGRSRGQGDGEREEGGEDTRGSGHGGTSEVDV